MLRRIEKLVEKNNLKKTRDLKQKKKEKKQSIRSTQETINYQGMMEDGVCQISTRLFSKSIKIRDFNYQMTSDEDQVNVFTEYCELLNSLDHQTKVQINIQKRKNKLFKDLLYENEGDCFDVYRQEMNDVIKEKVTDKKKGYYKEIIATFSQNYENYEKSAEELKIIEGRLISYFEAMGTEVESVDGKARLCLINNILNPDVDLYFQYKDLLYSDLTTHSMIAPTNFHFKKNKHTFEFGDCVGEVLFLKDYPAELSDKLIFELFELPHNFTVSLHIEPIPQDDAFDLVKTKVAFMEQQKVDEQKKALKIGYDFEMIPYELRYSLEEAKELLDDLQNKDQKLFRVTFLLFIHAENEEKLKKIEESVLSIARRNSCRFGKLDYLQEAAINSVLPIGKNLIPIHRTLTTSCVSVLNPFSARDVIQESGKYYGLNAITHSVISFDRRTLKAPNGFILGTSGSGKSFSAKREIINVLLKDKNAEVIIIDPEREYSVLADKFSGELVYISADSKSYINPMDINDNYDGEGDPVLLKTDFILSLCDLLLGGNQGLNAAQKTVIDRACRLTYANLFEKKNKEIPTLKDFYHVLKEQPEAEAQRLALDMEIYIEGSLSVFANKTNVDITNRLIVYDIKDLGKQLRTMGMLIVLDQIWNRITENRNKGIRTWVYIDEIQLLFTNYYSANYFFELWTRARKWGAIPTGITQNVETLLLSDLARRMLSNSDFVMMLNQSTSDRDELAHLFNISPDQERHITNCREGSGLLTIGNTIIPFYDEFPKDTQLYKMMSTKVEDSLINERGSL